MPIYIAPKAATGVQPRVHLHDDTVISEFDIAAPIGTAATGGGAGATAFALNDVIQMIKVQKGMKVVDVILSTDSLDSSTGVVTAVGDGTVADRFITGATIGRSGVSGLIAMNKHDGHGYEFPADDTIDVKITTAGTGTKAVAGKIRLSVRFSPQQ